MQRPLIPLLGLLASLLAALPAEAAKCPRGTLTGIVTYVRDGDTIEVGTMPIRLNGLAAPEGDEPGGAEATQAMLELVQGRTLRCELDGDRTHDRCVGVCYLDGADIAEVMVREGLARDCPRFSGGRYAKTERRAAANGATIGRVYSLPGYCR
jgi:micrococcal nuclease